MHVLKKSNALATEHGAGRTDGSPPATWAERSCPVQEPPPDRASCHSPGNRPVTLPVPAKGKSPSPHGEFSMAQRLMKPMRSKSPCPFLWPQGGLHPIPLGQPVLRLRKVCGAQGEPQLAIRTVQGPPCILRTEGPQLGTPQPGSE